jgi:uncharacterized protein (UPF0335 family)
MSNPEFGKILRQLIEKIERLEEDKATLSRDLRDVYAEAKSVGYDTKVMKRIIKDRKMRKDEIEELEALIDTYKHALGMV